MEDFDLNQLFSDSAPEDGADNIPTPIDQTDDGEQIQAPTQQQIDYEKRYKDIQSYHDKQRVQWEQEKREMAAKLQDVDGLVALRQVIQEDPDLINLIEAKLTGQPSPSSQHQRQHQGPNLPQRPQDFVPEDIYDPSTPSGRWYAEVNQIQQDYMMRNIANLVDQRLVNMEAKQAQARAEEARRRQQEQAQHELMEFLNSKDMSPEDRDTFLEFVATGPKRKPTLEDLYKWHVSMRDGTQPSTPPVSIDSKLRQMQTAPPQPTQMPSSTTKPVEENPIMDVLSHYGKKRWSLNK